MSSSSIAGLGGLGEGSPAAGSPTAGAGMVDGAEIARRMVQAVEAAGAAAKAAVHAVPNKPDDRSWFPILPKPPNFDPRSRHRRHQGDESQSSERDYSGSSR